MIRLEALEAEYRSLTRKIEQMEDQLAQKKKRQIQAHRYYEEMTKELEQAETDSFSNFLRSLVGKQEEKIEKEREEMIQARLKKDYAEHDVKEAQESYEELKKRAKRVEQELKDEQVRLSEEDPEYEKRIGKESEKRIQLQQVGVEIKEAFVQGNNVLTKIESALKELESADGWATWDIFGGGILTDVIKYEKIDSAENLMESLAISIERYQEELRDVKSEFSPEFTYISGTQRAFDFLLDDIFTNISTKRKIEENINELQGLKADIVDVQRKLVKAREEIEKEVAWSEKIYGDLKQ